MRFEFDTPNGTIKFRIWFKYESDRNGRREVCCFIDEEDAPGTTFAAGSAICAPSDRFCKETGRKVALKKALDGAPWAFRTDKDFRTAAWQCYHKRAEQPKGASTSGRN